LHSCRCRRPTPRLVGNSTAARKCNIRNCASRTPYPIFLYLLNRCHGMPPRQWAISSRAISSWVNAGLNTRQRLLTDLSHAYHAHEVLSAAAGRSSSRLPPAGRRPGPAATAGSEPRLSTAAGRRQMSLELEPVIQVRRFRRREVPVEVPFRAAAGGPTPPCWAVTPSRRRRQDY
jgi:hypothetical protein